MGRVLLVMGHRNTRGGNPEEERRTPEVVNALEPVLAAAGHDVHVLQREDGDDDPNFTQGGLIAVAAIAHDLIRTHDIEVMIDVHFQSSTRPVSGCFCIFPDAPGDTRVMNARSVSFANRLSREVSAETGIRRLPLRFPGGPGVMSEHQTAGGWRGRRLAMFKHTMPVRKSCVRVVMEHGDLVADRAIIDDPAFLPALGRAYLAAIDAFWPVASGEAGS